MLFFYLCNMILITSLSPNHINKNIQQKAIDSWNKLGLKCYSFNHPSEISELKYKGINIIETTNTMEHTFGKPYVTISTMIQWAKLQDSQRFCFINSDIELDYNPILLGKILKHSKHSMIIANRNDYEKDKKKTNKYILGIDAFFMDKSMLNIFPPSLFCMGQCFWDYNMPFTAIKNGINVINLQNKFAFHKRHNVQYSPKHWDITGKMFMHEHDIEWDNVGRINEVAFHFLELNTKKITL